MSQSAPTTDRIATLDLLRLVAALAVVAFHFFFRGAAGDPHLVDAYPQAAPYAIYGYLGVNLFFLISGFVIAASAEGRSWQSFAVARFARLYPGFVACMAISAAVLALGLHPDISVTLPQFLANLFIFSPALGQPFVDGVYWSIVLELIFYGWVALAVAAGVFSRLKIELVAVWLLVAALNEIFVGSGALRLLFLTEYGPLFAAGILTHYLATRGRSLEVIVLLVAAFLLTFDTAQTGRAWMLDHYGVALPLGGLVAANMAMYALFFGAVLLRRFVPASATILMLGGLTYPLYLLHQNIGYVMIRMLTPSIGQWAAALLALIAVLAVSWLVWRHVERPSRRLIVTHLQPVADWIAARMSGGATAETAPRSDFTRL